jgi:ribosome-associated protein
LLALLGDTLEEGKAEDVIVIDLVGKAIIADYMVIATGRSQRQISALAKNLIQNVKDAGLGPPGVEGLPQWFAPSTISRRCGRCRFPTADPKRERTR